MADEALALLRRLKGYTLPANRMTAARKLVDRLRLVEEDPAAMLRGLQGLERGLISLGASYDDELAQTLEKVERVFSGAQLVQIRLFLFTTQIQTAGNAFLVKLQSCSRSL